MLARISFCRLFPHSKEQLGLVTIVLLVLSLLAPITLTMHAAAGQDSSITLNPTSGPVDTLVNITGTGFTPIGQVILIFRNATSGQGVICGQCRADSSGAINSVFFVPSVWHTPPSNTYTPIPPGVCEVYAGDGYIEATAPFTVTAAGVSIVSVSPLQTDIHYPYPSAPTAILPVDVAVANEGSQAETFSLQATLHEVFTDDEPLTQTLPVTLDAGATQTLNFQFDIGVFGVFPGIYSIIANTSSTEADFQTSTLTSTLNVKISVFTAWDYTVNSYSQPNYGSQWDPKGNCYGLSSTALLYYTHKLSFPAQTPPAKSTSELVFPADVYNTLNPASLAVMIHQCYDPIYNYPHPFGRQDKEFKNVVDRLQHGIPILIGMGTDKPTHAVVVYAVTPSDDGTYNFLMSDPNFPLSIPSEPARYDLEIQLLTYSGYTAFEANLLTEPITQEWIPSSATQFASWKGWKDFVPNYDIVWANKPVTLKWVNGNGVLLKTYFNSGSLVAGIQGTAGIEENDWQVYSVYKEYRKQYRIADPSTDQSTIMIARVENDSATLSYRQFVVDVASVSGESLNFTVTPEDDGLSIVSSSNALTANVFLSYLDDQNSAFSTTNNLQIGANQNLTCTVADWQALNSTAPQFTVTEVSPPALTVTATASPTAIYSEGTSTIKVSVSSGGTAISGATINLTSDNGGTFSPIIDNANGTYIATFTAPDLTTQTTCIITATASKSGYSSGTKQTQLTVNPPAGAPALPLMWIAIAIILIAVITVGAVFAKKKQKTRTPKL